MMTAEQITRAQVLRDEGMPLPWIAEDLGLKISTVRRNTVEVPGARAAWREAWSQILRDKDLLELHWEFAPKIARRT